MNKPIRTVSLFCMVLFLALLANTTYLQFFQAASLNDRADNRRALVADYSAERGQILVGRTGIAKSEPSDDQYRYQRVYPFGGMYAHLTGWFYLGNQTHLERIHNGVLSGDDPSLFVTQLFDLLSNEPAAGGNVSLTLNERAQKAAYDALGAVGENVQGSVVALEPSTGKVLAMVSLPSFDPNRLSVRDGNEVVAYDQQLQARDDKPLENRSIQTTLPPGSTFKIVTAAAALEDDESLTAESQVPGGSSYTLPNTRTSIGNGGRSCGATTVSFGQAMAQSCNTTFLALAADVGQEKMAEQAEKFGFNAVEFDDLDGAVASAYPDNDELSQTSVSGIGQQDVRATPLQMAMVVGAIANDGVVMKPYLVDQITTADFDNLSRTEPEEIGRATSTRTAREIQRMLVETVENGTAGQAAIDGVEVGAKTGTAENCSGCRPYAWFVSYGERDGRDVAVAVMLQNVSDNVTISGGGLGGPVAKAVMEAVLEE